MLTRVNKRIIHVLNDKTIVKTRVEQSQMFLITYIYICTFLINYKTDSNYP